MNDYWNDPPESPETPECCGDFMDYDEKTGACTCPTCGKHVEPEPDIEPPDDEPSDAEIAAWFAANPSPVPDRCPTGASGATAPTAITPPIWLTMPPGSGRAAEPDHRATLANGHRATGGRFRVLAGRWRAWSRPPAAGTATGPLGASGGPLAGHRATAPGHRLRLASLRAAGGPCDRFPAAGTATGPLGASCRPLAGLRPLPGHRSRPLEPGRVQTLRACACACAGAGGRGRVRAGGTRRRARARAGAGAGAGVRA